MSFLKSFLSYAAEAGTEEIKNFLKDKQDDDYYLNLGYAYSSSGKTIKAIESYKKAIEKDPKSSDAYFSLGLEYYFSENYESYWKL